MVYGFRAHNLAALNAAGPVLLLPNHVSWLDWIFIGVYLGQDWRFVTSRETADISWLHRLVMVNRLTFPVDMNSPYAMKRMAEYLQKGGRLVLFPEGRLTTTGSLMKLFDGTGFLIFKTRPKVITAYIRGADRLPFSPNPNAKRWFARVSVHFSEVLTPPNLEQVSASEARTNFTEWLRRQMIKQRFETEMEFGPKTVPEAIERTARLKPGWVAVQDFTMQKLSYRRIQIGARVLSGRWQTLLEPGAGRVGVLLPNVNTFPVVLLSLWQAGKVPAILNYSSGPTVVAACARLAGLKHVITSKAFLERSGFDPGKLKEAGVRLVLLEDVRAGISGFQKLAAWLAVRLNLQPAPASAKAQPEGTAVILFTSGSEGDPKGVELTHRNLLANIRQMLSVIDLMDSDRFFNALPLFHSFGVAVGLLLPLVQGSFVFLYLSPLHYRVVPSVFYNIDCTVFFGTNTFLAGYARKAHPYDFRTLRYVFAGAEKIHESTSTAWMRKFGARVLEGYGATECSPCVSVNVPLHPRNGSAGQFLPGIEYRLEPVEGVESKPAAVQPGARIPHADLATSQPGGEAGRLFVRGPNVMRGYLNPEANAKFTALGGWYDTGDIARVDADGFVYILGRLKRFAKISGEMVSLTAVEEALANAFPEYGLRFGVAVITLPDEAKGEKLVAVTNEARLTLNQVREAVRARGLNNLAAPRELKVLDELPHLGSGKIDHRELQRKVSGMSGSNPQGA
jgi:acyl-[acyl-carrier-protein]-phospholipid O-acyltransferase/long-chain-fatty-acid--[acyl-carrier-protein] ligase